MRNEYGKKEQKALSGPPKRAAKEAEAGLSRKGDEEYTNLMLAVSEGDIVTVEDLIAAGARVNDKNRFGDTALMLAADKGHTEIAQALIKAGAKVDAKNWNDYTALMLAADKGHTEIEGALKEAQVKLDTKQQKSSPSEPKQAAAPASETANGPIRFSESREPTKAPGASPK